MKKHFQRMVLLLVAYLWSAVGLRAQPAQFQFKHLTADDGLSNVSESAMLQDRSGFMWFGTQDGLFRYDGYDFISYTHDPGDSTSLSHNWIWSLHEDDDGNIWVGTRIGGFDRFDPVTRTFTHIDLEPNHLGQIGPIFAIHEDREGILWIATGQAGLQRLDRASGSIASYVHDPDNPRSLSDAANSARALYEDPTGDLWVGTWGGGLNRFNRETESFEAFYPDPLSPPNTILDITSDGEGRLWIATEHSGLFLFDPAHGTFTQPKIELESDDIRGLEVDRFGALWVGTWGAGLYRYDRSDGTLARATHRPVDPQSLNENRVLGLYEDRVGNLWVSTYDTGVSRIDLEMGTFSTFSHDPIDAHSLGPGRVWAVHQDRQGRVWLGTRGGVARFELESGTFEYLPGFPSVMSISEDADGRLWFGTGSEGLLRFDPNSGASKVYRYDPANRLGGNHVRVVHVGRDGEIWFGTWGWGLFRLDPHTEALTRFQFDSRLPANTVTALHQDGRGRLWVGTWESGLFLFDRASASFRRIAYGGALLTTTVWTLFEGQGGKLWVGTADGLHIVDLATGEVDHITRQNSGLPHNDVRGILDDGRGQVWIGTGRGISRYDPKTHTFQNYDVHDGLVGNDLTTNGAFRSGTGMMYFGEASGLITFHPDAIRPSPHPPLIALTELRLFNEPVVPGPESPLQTPIAFAASISLAPRQNDLSIGYVGLHYRRPEQNSYAYMLEGYENAWRYVGPQRTAIYPNLPPGEYVFRVKASNSDGVWSTESAAIRVVLRPPWWRTWWAYVLYAVLFVTGVVAVDRVQRQRLIARERKRGEIEEAKIRAETAELNARIFEDHAQRLEELDMLKSRFFANVSHELRTPLTLILGPLYEAQQHGDADRLLSAVPLMRRSASRLLDLIGQLLDLAKLDSGAMQIRARRTDLVPFLREIVLSFAGRAELEKLRLLFDTSEAELWCHVDVDQLEKVITNLLSNAVKFTDAGGKVRVGLRRVEDGQKDVAEITVSDTGIGIPEEEIGSIFDRFHQVDASATRSHEGAGIGLALVKELVALHHGTISLESKSGFGTMFTLALPLGTSHLDPSEIIGDDGSEDEIPIGGKPEPSQPAAQYPDPSDTSDDSDGEERDDAARPLVLVVEDNTDMRRYLVGLLADVYRVLEAADGAAGVEIARQATPDLVLADLMMPGIDGFDLCRMIKEDEALGHVPVVLLTARADDESRLDGLGAGADDYLQKPFQPDELLARLENLIELRRRLRQRFSKQVLVGPREIVVPSSEEVFVTRVQETVEKHLGDANFGVDWLADEVGMSRRHLGRRLNAAVGLSPGGYIRMMRLERAAQLLEQQAGTVQEIAYGVGFNDADHFSKIFRQAFGVTPSMYTADGT